MPCPTRRGLGKIAGAFLTEWFFAAVSLPLLFVAEPYSIMTGAVQTGKAIGELGSSYAAQELRRIDRLRVEDLQDYETALLVGSSEASAGWLISGSFVASGLCDTHSRSG